MSLHSPDPLTLASSPLGARSTRASSRPLVRRSSNTPSKPSPSKSFVLETGAAGHVSPWRIKVTVEAEPKDDSVGEILLGSPAKRRPARRRTRVTRVALKNDKEADVMMPGDSEADIESARPPVQRKRKATPTRRRAARSAEQDDAALMPPPPLPTSSATKARRRRSLIELPVERHSKRLSQAREELDLALQDAVGSTPPTTSDDDDDDDVVGIVSNGRVPGDMTVMDNEDFTMVSVETLQSMRADTSLVSHRNTGGEGDKSGLSVSYLPSSPPKRQSPSKPEQNEEMSVYYPDLSSAARNAAGGRTYDDMSWKATGLAKELIPEQAQPTALPAEPETDEQQITSESPEWRRAREAIGRKLNEAGHSHVVDRDGTARREDIYEDENLNAEQQAADIWQEEASRSFESELVDSTIAMSRRHRAASRRPRQPAPAAPAPQATAPKEQSPQLNDLFEGQPIRPRRAKIPRTWRRTSGADFAYSDSPAHDLPAPLRVRKRDHSTGGESRASSGVLTPPESEDGQGVTNPASDHEHEDAAHAHDEDVDFTSRPDAEATPYQPRPANRIRAETVLSDDSSSGVTSPENEDTGLFWQTAMPALYNRPQPTRPRVQRSQKRAMELSELLDLQKTSSPAKEQVPKNAMSKEAMRAYLRPARHSPLHMRPVEGRIKMGGAGDKVVSSPLRRSLLKSSKVGGSPVGKAGGVAGTMFSERVSKTVVEGEGTGVDESWASKASDQRQLLREIAGVRQESHGSQDQCEDEEGTQLSAEQDGVTESYTEHSYLTEETAEEEEGATEEATRSYEEHLNIESPQKIKVHFGDSMSGSSALLAPKREYAPLFAPDWDAARMSRQQARSPPTITLVGKMSATTTSQQQGASIFTRLSTNFWSAVVRPTGPSEIIPAQQSQAQDKPYPPALRAHIRSRYGVLPSVHPWTFSHMRTLHRMLNSCTSGRSDTIIPKPGTPSPDLPIHVRNLVGTTQTSITGYGYTFTEQSALIVHTFSQVLVPAHIVEAMEDGEVEMLGDATAREYNGLYCGTHGKDLVWGDRWGVRKAGEEVEWRYVVGALGDCLRANEGTAAAGR